MIDELLLKLKNRRLIIMLFPVIAGVFIGSTMVVQPALKKIGHVKNDKRDLAQKAEALKNVLALEKKLETYKERLAPVVEKSQLIDKLNSLASQSGLSVLSIVPDEKKTAGNFEYVPIRIDADGNYHQLGEFVSRVENLPQTAKIMNIDINSSAFDDSDFGSLTPGMAPLRGRSGGSRTYKMSVTAGFFSAS